MRDRTYGRISGMSEPVPQPLESLRRQLEGRWERIEQAREHYAQLTRQLSSFQWKQALRSQPELLKETREQEAELDEVLTYVEHRAHREQWPSQHPGLRVLQELRALRAKLEALAHKRLAQRLSHPAASLGEALGELETLVLAPLPQPPGADDAVLFEDWMLSGSSPGRVWLTPKRLLWQPRSGEPVQVLLAPLERDAITLLPGWIGVHVKRAGLTLFSLSYAKTLASLLRLGLRTAPLWHERPEVHDVVTGLAYRHHADYMRPERWGMAVFRPEGVALLPASHRTLLDLCRSLLGLGARQPQPSELRRLEALVEQLRLLPPDEFDRTLRELIHARGGKFWPSAGIHLLTPPGQDVMLQVGEQRLVVSQHPDAVRQFLLRHSHGNAPLAERSWWQKHPREKLGIAVGLALYYTSGMLPAWSSLVLMLTGHVLYSWACMRFSKAKGYPALLGLVLSIVCTPGMLVFLAFAPKKQPSK